MKWSLDTHKFISETVRTALRILVDNKISLESSEESIKSAEIKLFKAGVYKSAESAEGRVRRALFTYLRAYGLFKQDCTLSDFGRAFYDNKLSVAETCFHFLVNYRYTNSQTNEDYYPLNRLLCFEKKCIEKGHPAFISLSDFDGLVAHNGVITDSDYISIIGKRNQPNTIDARNIGFDVWTYMLLASGLFVKDDNKNLLIANRELADWLINYYSHSNQFNKGDIYGGYITNIPVVPANARAAKNTVYYEAKPIAAYLFSSIDTISINRYICSIDSSVEGQIVRFGLLPTSKGYYEKFAGYEHIVGYALCPSADECVHDLGMLLLNLDKKDNTVVGDEMKEEESVEMIDRQPRTHKSHDLNCIIYGAPGTGKTYSTVQYAVDVCDNKPTDFTPITKDTREEYKTKYDELVGQGRIVFTTFHQSYGYEDFIQGLRPDTNSQSIKFVPVDGVFKKIADKAMMDAENDYVIIIDEINRGNISKVFGELITLVEDDKRWGEYNQMCVELPSGQKFAVPNNLYIVGTMNSADKSISLIDAALRRRFQFQEQSPNPELLTDDALKTVLKNLNEALEKELDSTDLLIGHSYFIGKDASDLCQIMNRSIIPLLYEYFFDNSKKVRNILKSALEGQNVELVEGSCSRIKIKNKD